MAGVKFSLELEDLEVQAELKKLAQLGKDALDAALRDVGEHLLNATRARFEAERDPQGRPWVPLSDAYRARKPKNEDQILTLDGWLRGLLRYQVAGGELAVGTDRIYGATHQFGDPERGIPARPFLGLSEQDRRDVLDILAEHIEDALRG